MKLRLLISFMGLALLLTIVVSLGTYVFSVNRPNVEKMAPGGFGTLHFWMVDDSGKILSSNTSLSLPDNWNALPHPTAPDAPKIRLQGRAGQLIAVSKLMGNPGGYIVIQRTPPPLSRSLPMMLVIFFPAMLGSIALVALVLLIYGRTKGRIAHTVIAALKSGDLKARFPIGRLDEVGRLMFTFNEMADEVERLVLKLRSMESSRRELLRGLAHDLRTPLTSLAVHVETVAETAPKLAKAEIQRKMRIAHGELNYFKRLLEDIFVLANLEDPAFTPELTQVEPLGVIAKELDQLQKRCAEEKRKLRFELQAPDSGVPSVLATSYLLQRLFRNALENAAGYARKKVRVIVENSEKGATYFIIRDDGPGMSTEAFEKFGKKHHSRFLNPDQAGRVSLGLGSIIMSKIAGSLGGSVSVKNWESAPGKTGGTELSILLPTTPAGVLSDKKAA